MSERDELAAPPADRPAAPPADRSAAQPAANPAPLGGVIGVLRRGLAESPELRVGLRVTVAMATVVAAGRLVVPIAIQQILDRGLTGPDGLRVGFVVTACSIAAVVLVGIALLSRLTYLRLVRAAENMLYGLRTRTFAHVHRLSVASHNESKRGVLVTRVTSDIETIAQFAQWGAISWIVNSVIIVGTLTAIAVYSWQLALIVVVIFSPVAPLLRWVQRHQIAAYDHVRTTVGDTLTEISETVMGAPVIRVYGMQRSSQARLHRAIARQYKAQMRAAWYFALMFPVSDVFGAVALGTVIGVGATQGPAWGLGEGSLVAVVFLTGLLLQPIGEIGEILDQTQTAVAGWRKVLDLLDEPIDVVEPDSGVELARGALSVDIDGVSFSYLTADERSDADLVSRGEVVLDDVTLRIDAGTNVAIVGETGSGKTTLAKLVCRLADPTDGVIRIDGVDLRSVARPSRLRSVRMVPQDGFLFSGSVAENISLGVDPESDEAAVTTADVRAAVEELGLGWWIDRLPNGLDTEVGERGENLSVGERQLVALARAQLADPGLLILDEATSAVDPETERALSQSLVRLAEGRTTISVAHRLSTAEAADLVVVFDRGRIVEVGAHAELVGAGGVYARLHESWVGNTRSTPAATP